jgi:hypothetical protein
LRRRARLHTLVPLLSAAGCASIIGADFDELRLATPCDACAGDASAGRASGGDAGSKNGGGASGRAPIAAGTSAATTGGSEPTFPIAGEGGTAGQGGEPPADPCASNAECMDRYDGRPYLCRRRTCVPITTEACPLILPSAGWAGLLRQGSTILTGAFAGVRPPYFADPASVNFDLAFTEFHADAASVFGGGRHLLAVVCDGDRADILPALNHLTRELGVTGVLSALSPDKLLRAYTFTTTDEFRAERGPVFFLAGLADGQLANLEDHGFVWHMLGSPRVLATATAGLVRFIESPLYTARLQHHERTGIDDPRVTPLRLTLVTADEPSLLDAANVLTAGDTEHPSSNLSFNGKYAVEQPDAFRQLGLDSAEAILTDPPHVIVALAGPEVVPLIQAVELGWGQAPYPAGLQRPYWVLFESASHAAELPGAVAALDTSSTPPLSDRLVGVGFASSEEPLAKGLDAAYQNRLLRFNQNVALTPALSGTGHFYDAAYALIYSYGAAAVNGSAVGAIDLRDAFKTRVYSLEDDAETVNVGPAFVGQAMQVLGKAQSNMSLYGTSGTPNFERSSGTRIVATSAWCLEPQDAQRPYVYDALLYDPDSDTYQPPLLGIGSCMTQF